MSFVPLCCFGFAVATIGRLATKDTVLFLCDMQEKFRPNIFQFPNIVSNASRLLQVWRTKKITFTQLNHLYHFICKVLHLIKCIFHWSPHRLVVF